MAERTDLGLTRTGLSERELEIIELVATGLTNQEIALKLMISKRTVDNHVSNIFTKTGAKNRVALLNWAMDNGKICRDGFNCCSLPPAVASRPIPSTRSDIALIRGPGTTGPGTVVNSCCHSKPAMPGATALGFRNLLLIGSVSGAHSRRSDNGVGASRCMIRNRVTHCMD
jgi:DNA-binding CsgD family transcriptional regulator